MWVWVFFAIALIGVLWHALLVGKLFSKAKTTFLATKPLAGKLAELSTHFNEKPAIEKPKRAVDRSLDEVLLERLKTIRGRRRAKAERQRRLIANLKKIDPTERRFTRVRKRS